MAVRFVSPQVQALDTLGVKAPGAKLRFYDAGTTDPRTVYSDDGLSIAYVQPIVADSAGVWPAIFLPTGVYKVTIHSSADVLLATYDDIDPSLSTNAGALAVASGGTGATTAAGARSNLGAYSQVAGDALDDRLADVELILDNPLLAASLVQTYAASFTPDFTAAETRHVTLTGGLTLNAPTATVGQTFRLFLIQDATGSRTWTVNSAYKFAGGVVPPLSTTANAVDELWGHYRASGVAEVEGFKRQDALTNIAILEDQKTANTDGGTFTSGADRTRDLNTEVSDLSGFVTLSSNQFTLLAGTYHIQWWAPAFACNGHQSMLYNITASAVAQRGSTERNDNTVAVGNTSTGSAIVSFSSSTVFEIRHRCTTTRSTDGFGDAMNFGTEVYTRVVIRRLP
jgi:hypothetical protein